LDAAAVSSFLKCVNLAARHTYWRQPAQFITQDLWITEDGGGLHIEVRIPAGTFIAAGTALSMNCVPRPVKRVWWEYVLTENGRHRGFSFLFFYWRVPFSMDSTFNVCPSEEPR
jgi:hypothetical protein